ncbi:MAG TPA: DNA replication/repair protein RecF [Nannocystaceae bacterium]|nr:DNA replication/repair protein RecF [Nannocystaceae bacterium]
MLIERLTVQDFRNFAAAELELGGRFTVLFGENGAGKTNLIEALYLVSTLRSFRVSELAPLLRHGADEARVELRGVDPALDLHTRLAVHLVRSERSLRRVALADGKVVRSATDFYGRARAILFTPEDLGVLRGSPGGRRNFLDRVLFARDRAHIGDIQSYEKLLRSRNHVLKSEGNRASRDHLLETYEIGLAAAGARIWIRRERLLRELRPYFVAVFSQIHGAGRETSLAYDARLGEVPEDERERALLEAHVRRRSDDLIRGTTTTGPHRDDFVVRLDDQTVGDFASQGQTRALVLAFKIAELRAARDLCGEPPLLLLDDVSSELDPTRNAQLFRALTEDAGQCVLTTTAPDFVRLGDAAETAYVEVVGGTLRVVRRAS